MHGENESFIFIIYVDDILPTGSDKEAIQNAKAILHSQFVTKDLGFISYFRGIGYSMLMVGLFCPRGSIWLTCLRMQGCLVISLHQFLWIFLYHWLIQIIHLYLM
jgi:hypothetical protein